MSLEKEARKLIYTDRGKIWLDQFDYIDQEVACLLVNNLTLVSHNEFERNIVKTINNIVDRESGVVAFFAMRELEPMTKQARGKRFHKIVDVSRPYYDQVKVATDGKSIVPLGQTADIGSEGRVVSIIRQFCKQDRNRFLNHPTLEELKAKKCRHIVCIDDFIGSGKRAFEFVNSLWAEKTIVSWNSSKYIKVHVAAYSGTDIGIKKLESHRSLPVVHVYKDAPTFNSMPWSREKKDEVIALCNKYGRKANKKRKNFWLGFKDTMSAMIFEHGCPNNVPLILTEDSEKWSALFPRRLISPEMAGVFPDEISQKTKLECFKDIGVVRLSMSSKLHRRGEIGNLLLMILALISKGQRKRATLCYATGLNNEDCERFLASCIKWNFVSPQKRITAAGLSELKAASKIGKYKNGLLNKGSDYYFPQQLREAT